MLIGCGNSNLGHDMWLDGFTNIESMDYAQSVIQHQNEKYAKMYADDEEKLARVKQQCRFTHADMLDMSNYDSESFDVVIDKATMDVLLTDNKDPWNPADHVVQRSNTVLKNCQRVIKQGGQFISISFDQPHFRKKLLLSDEVKDGWLSCTTHNIDHGLGYFMFVLPKK